MGDLLTYWPGFARVLDESRICMTNGAAERGLALARKPWPFAGSVRGGQRAEEEEEEEALLLATAASGLAAVLLLSGRAKEAVAQPIT